ncbi:TPA: hypothetical protein ACKFDM_001610, partial [Neisseria gonorrhoeae]
FLTSLLSYHDEMTIRMFSCFGYGKTPSSFPRKRESICLVSLLFSNDNETGKSGFPPVLE